MSDIAETDKNLENLARPGFLRLSPINQRRWQAFNRNKRGAWALWIFLTLFVIALCAEFIANDRPLLIYYKGEVLFPVFFHYSEEKFGGTFPNVDYHDPIIINEINDRGWMIWPPVHFADQTINLDVAVTLPSPPTWSLSDDQCRPTAERLGLQPPVAKACWAIEQNWLGTDAHGRDIVARVLYGFRLSVLFGLILTALASIIGVAVGAIQGYFGGWLDLITQRFIEIWSALPQLYILMIIASILSPGFFVLLLVMLLFSWVGLVHLVRAEFLRARNFEYVNAARALGLPNYKIILKHVLPNAMVATLTFLPFTINGAIGSLTALDILGLGMPNNAPSLGEILLEGRENLSAPWISITGFITVAMLLSLLIFIGEAVRDSLDPRKSLG